MESSHAALLKELLRQRRVLALSVLADGEPVIGLLPFAVAPDHRALVIHASQLARHSRGLRNGAPFDALIHLSDTPEADPLQIPRLTLQGTVRVLSGHGPETEADRRAYIEKLPAAAPLLGFGDFHSYRLEIKSGRLVAGFAQAVSFTADTLRQILH
jgi:putative heme iron utilization protein